MFTLHIDKIDPIDKQSKTLKRFFFMPLLFCYLESSVRNIETKTHRNQCNIEGEWLKENVEDIKNLFGKFTLCLYVFIVTIFLITHLDSISSPLL